MSAIFLALTAGILLEPAAVYLWVSGRSGWLPAAALHAASSVLVWAAFFAYSARNPRSRHLGILGFSALFHSFFPGAGALCVLGLIPAVRMVGGKTGLRYAQRAGDEDLFESEVVEDSLIASENILRKYRSEMSFQPYVDILAGNDNELKIQVIEKLSHHFIPENVSLLKQTLQHREPEIRLYTANALLKMEAYLHDRVHRARRRAQQQGTAAAYAVLGDLYREYAASGLLDEVLAAYYFQQALEAYQNSLDKNTDRSDVLSAYIRCLVRLGKVERAKGLVTRAVQTWPRDTHLRFLSHEIYFYEGQFRRVAEDARETDAAALSRREQEVVRFWTQI